MIMLINRANPIALAIIIVALTYYMIFSSLPSNQYIEASSQNIPTLGFEILLWGIFIVCYF